MKYMCYEFLLLLLICRGYSVWTLDLPVVNSNALIKNIRLCFLMHAVERILKARTITEAPPMAPACGLYLAAVKYDFSCKDVNQMEDDGE